MICFIKKLQTSNQYVARVIIELRNLLGSEIIDKQHKKKYVHRFGQ